jgi:hypothetical protein
MHFGTSRVLAALLLLTESAQATKCDGPNYESLPLDTVFPGPWEENIRAPVNKSHILPVKIFNFEGAVAGVEAVLQDASTAGGISWVIGPGGLVTFEFAESISGRYDCFAQILLRGANGRIGSVSKSMDSRTIPTLSCPTPSLLSSLAANPTRQAIARLETCLSHIPSNIRD